RPFRAASQTGVARVAPRGRAYPWSSSRQPKTKPSAGFWCYAGSFPLSAKPDIDIRRTANVAAAPIHRPVAGHIDDRRSRQASGRQPGTVGRLLPRRTSTEIHAKSSETTGEARAYTTAGSLLKQPDKHKLASACPVVSANTKMLWSACRKIGCTSYLFVRR